MRPLIWFLGTLRADDDFAQNYYDLSDFFEIERSEGRVLSDSPVSDEPLYYYEAPIYDGLIDGDVVGTVGPLKTDLDYGSIYDDSSSEFDQVLRLQNEFSYQVSVIKKLTFEVSSHTKVTVNTFHLSHCRSDVISHPTTLAVTFTALSNFR